MRVVLLTSCPKVLAVLLNTCNASPKRENNCEGRDGGVTVFSEKSFVQFVKHFA